MIAFIRCQPRATIYYTIYYNFTIIEIFRSVLLRTLEKISHNNYWNKVNRDKELTKNRTDTHMQEEKRPLQNAYALSRLKQWLIIRMRIFSWWFSKFSRSLIFSPKTVSCSILLKWFFHCAVDFLRLCFSVRSVAKIKRKHSVKLAAGLQWLTLSTRKTTKKMELNAKSCAHTHTRIRT